LRLVSRPPFDRQSQHDERLATLRRERALFRARAADAVDQGAIVDAAARAHPEDLFLADARARSLQRRGQPDAAARIWAELLERVPGTPKWITSRAFALAAAGRGDAAGELLDGLVAAEPGLAEAHLNRAALALDLGRLEDAERALQRTLELAPGHPLGRLDLAWLRELEAQPEEALALYEEAARAPAVAPEALARRGALLARLGRSAEAEAVLRRALDLDPGQSPAGNALGVLLEGQGRLDEAARVYRAVLAADPANALALFNLADALLAAGEAGGATTAYQMALRLEPGNEQARLNLTLARRLAGVGQAGRVDPVGRQPTPGRPER
jgi:tetratricopeptide (TPR) repeat protein